MGSITSPTTATFTYLQQRDSYEHGKPYEIYGHLPPEHEGRRTNMIFEKRPDVPVSDVRNHVSDFKLETHGFQYFQHKSETAGAVNGNGPPLEYLEELVEWLTDTVRKEDGGQTETEELKVILYDYRFRRNLPSVPSDHMGLGLSMAMHSEPAWFAHNDLTDEGAPRRAKKQLNDAEIETYMNPHWRLRMLNIWRPLNNTIKDAPLAFIDPLTLSRSDLVAVDRVTPATVGEVYYLHYNPKHRWYFLDSQTPDEVSVFKSWDSDPVEAEWRCTPHAAFKLPHQEGVQPRESLEVRAMVFSKN